MAVQAALAAHLATGTTQVCRAWILRRQDGRVLGFTDHDRDLTVDGVSCRADTGLSAQALSQTTGLSVDNSDAMGALSDAAVTEADLLAGRYDGASIEAWLVNWADPDVRTLRFRGSIGEIESGGGGFRAELRGLAQALNQSRGRAYQPLCAARLGDAACGIDLGDTAYSVEARVAAVRAPNLLHLEGAAGFAAEWFTRGRIEVIDGAAAGLRTSLKVDAVAGTLRHVTLWEELRAAIAVGDRVRLIAGCDKRAETCRTKFGNFLNHRGFPHIPGEDWLMAYPKSGGRNNGGSLAR